MLKIQLGWTRQKLEIEGGDFTCEMRPLTSKALAALMEIAPKGTMEAGSPESITYGIESLRSTVVPAILTEHVRAIEGIEDEHGAPVISIDALIGQSIATRICSAMITRLSQISVLSGADGKN